MELNKIKVYDVDALLHEQYNMEAFRYHKVAVFEGANGVVVAEEEGVHQMVSSLFTEDVEIPANEPAAPGKMWITAEYLMLMTAKEIQTAPYSEVTMPEFFKRRNYNGRTQDNWKTLRSSLDKIGFDLTGYLPEERPLFQKIQASEKQSTKLKITGQMKEIPIQDR